MLEVEPVGGAAKSVEAHAFEARYLAEFDFRYNQSVALAVNDPARMEGRLWAFSGNASPIGAHRHRPPTNSDTVDRYGRRTGIPLAD